MSGNKAMRRALASADVVRVNTNLPTITDKTELISPDDAKEMLKNNKNNRPVNWRKVEEYAAIMRRGEWKLHPQGIIFDPDGNILTGQTRLWAIIYADSAVYLRVSRGSPADTAFVIDRGRPQSARDLSTRKTERKHSPIESSIARCVCILLGNPKPAPDDIANVLVEKDVILATILKTTTGTKKDKAMLMILGAIAFIAKDTSQAGMLAQKSRVFGDQLESALVPYKADACWGRGVAFSMALDKARHVVETF